MASMLTSTSSGSSATMGPPGAAAAPAPHVDEVREQDRFLPIANISRIMKKSLPPNAKIAKDAKETVQECVSEFISFVTSEASEKCQKEKRKTINGECYASFFFFFFSFFLVRALLFSGGEKGQDFIVKMLKLYDSAQFH